MRKLLIFASLGLTVLLTACTKNYIDPYDPPTNNTYTFVDEFVDNRNDWSFADLANDAYGGITNGGTFAFSYLDVNGAAYYRSKNIQFNPDRNFVIKTRIGSDNNIGLNFGFDGNTGAYGYSFTVSEDGYFALWDEGGNGNGVQDITAIISPRQSNVVNANGDWNDVEIEQRGNQWIGYINNTEVFRVNASYLPKGSLGFVVVGGTRGEADFIEATYY